MVILQHRRERFHPFNTARIVHQALSRCELLVNHNKELAEQFETKTLSGKAALLFPDPNAPELSQLSADQMPDQLVVIDGTWHQAKTLLRDMPKLATLNKVRLAPTSPGQYRIRREPDQHALSTLEATVSALQSIEPETIGLNKLTDAFNRMIGDQLSNKSSNWRQNQKRRRGSANIPKVLTGDPAKIVVAYGEREPGRRGDRKHCRQERLQPVYWTATRLDGSESFECLIQSEALKDPTFLQHLAIDQASVASAVSTRSFREQWKSFLRPDDCLFVDRQSTANLLVSCNADFMPSINLKAIEIDYPADLFSDCEDVDASPRAHRRLANLVRQIKFLVSTTI
ncbi:DTW domain protein [Rubripirellula obstinata]|uniref:tRNA-uridine aminocarboxypropyltransferase n=1 Tax=Rubripirellula obstinata TaxID=406547 RepID=A0A5B1CE16_9BACT|nr:DTW domain protein [Rubripirellula obstinata]